MLLALALVGAARGQKDAAACPCEPCVEGVGMRDNASWGFYRLSPAPAPGSQRASGPAASRATTRACARCAPDMAPSSRPCAGGVLRGVDQRGRLAPRLGDTVDCDDGLEEGPLCARNALRPAAALLRGRRGTVSRSVVPTISPRSTRVARTREAPPERSRAYVAAAV